MRAFVVVISSLVFGAACGGSDSGGAGGGTDTGTGGEAGGTATGTGTGTGTGGGTQTGTEPEVDECAEGTDDCDVNAACIDLVDGYSCECNSGFSGDGVSCSDIDECAEGTDDCDEHASCSNEEGSFSCACDNGWAGDGVSCSDIDECAAGTDDCDDNASCNNTDGSFSCSCNAGYSGNGVTCDLVEIIWNSWEVVSDSLGARVTAGPYTAPLILYQSISLTNVDVESILTFFHPGPHPEAFNHVQSYWALEANPQTYPFVGKSMVDRGFDSGEANAPAPLGVRDLTVHPPEADKLVGMAFMVPVIADYTITGLAARRVDSLGNTATFKIYAPCYGAPLETIQVTDDQDWVTSSSSFSLGLLGPGNYICMGVQRDGDFAWDAVEIAWTITATP